MNQPFHSTRAILSLTGQDVEHFLQGILTQDVTQLASKKILFAALLSPQGKILHDMFLVQQPEGVLIDTPSAYKEVLLKRLHMYKLRAKVTITDETGNWFAGFGDHGFDDPRHPQLPKRIYSHTAIEQSFDEYRDIELGLGIPDSGLDFTPDSIVAMDAGYDLLNAISFTKGCYVGQEVTARMHYKNIARKGFYILKQLMKPVRLALLRFDEVEEKAGQISVDNVLYEASLPDWMEPKIAQFREGAKNQ